MLIVLFLFMVSLSFSLLNYVDWYGLHFCQTKSLNDCFFFCVGGDIDLTKTSSFVYTFESSQNPHNLLMVTNGFTLVLPLQIIFHFQILGMV